MEENALYEIEGMKQQIALLKKKLESQTIVSEQMLDKAIRTNLSKLNRRAWFTGIVGAVAIPYCWYVFSSMNLSTAFCVATAFFLLACIVATWIQYRGLSAANLMQQDLLTVSTKMQRLRKQHLDWLKFSIPTLVAWLAWFCIEIYISIPEEHARPVIIGATVGAIVGSICGICFLRASLKTIRETLRQIDDLRQVQSE